MAEKACMAIQAPAMPGPFSPPFILDRDAYMERRAIMEEALHVDRPNATLHDMQQIWHEAAESGYRTTFAQVATSAARSDWEPAKAFCRRLREQFDDGLAREVMRDIQQLVRDKLNE